LDGEPLPIVKETLPDAITNIYTDLSIENFFNTARVYIESLPDASLSEVLEKTNSTLSVKTPVNVETYGGEKPSSYTRFYFNYMSYSMVSILVLGTSIIMLLWRDLPLLRRTEVSPLKKSSIQLQKVLSLGVFTLLTFVLLNVFYFLVNRNAVLDDKTLLHIGNSFILAFTSMGMSFLVGTLLKSRNAITAVSNVVSLGPSFISGVFVPQALLGEGVLTLAKVTPTYYYVTANELIAALGNSMNEKIYTNMMILFAFGIVFFLLAFYFGQRRKTTSS
ncbi:ABC transporter permease, partial [Proteiniclasticum ruminis]|uniref:ABC transporter permease n=1 Tax=Proteiniclasticum ruminis TaxID=398199 RepID=UPI0028A07220